MQLHQLLVGLTQSPFKKADSVLFEIESETEGSFIKTVWNLLARAASFSIYFECSFNVVAPIPDPLNLDALTITEFTLLSLLILCDGFAFVNDDPNQEYMVKADAAVTQANHGTTFNCNNKTIYF